MGFLKRVQDAIWETLDEFQFGPDRPGKKKRKKKPRPKWMDLRKRRLPEKKVVKQEPRDIKQEPKKTWQRLKKEYAPMEIKREAAVFKQEPQEPWEKQAARDPGINVKIEEPQERVERILTEPVKKKLKKNRQFYDIIQP